MASGPNAGTTTHWYAGGFERETRTADNTTQVRLFLPQGVVLTDRYTSATADVTTAATTRQLRYYQRDRLGSTTAITDETGAVLERQFFDPWGQRRNGDGSASLTLQSRDHRYGYTEHEMLDAIGLVHMNGRIYDPLLARFMSADPTIPDPTDGQNYNRYSYVLNSPTNYTDPSGFAQVRQVEMVGNWGSPFGGGSQTGLGGWGSRMTWTALAEIPKFDEEWQRTGGVLTDYEQSWLEKENACKDGGWACYQKSEFCKRVGCIDGEGGQPKSDTGSDGKSRQQLETIVIEGTNCKSCDKDDSVGRKAVDRFTGTILGPDFARMEQLRRLQEEAWARNDRAQALAYGLEALGLLGAGAVAGAKAQPKSNAVTTKPPPKPLSPNQMNKAIQTGQAPPGIKRIDTGKVKDEQTHATFGKKEGKDEAALNQDGTWKHGKKELTNAQKSWLRSNGWNI